MRGKGIMLQSTYNKQVVPEIVKEFNLKNEMAAPRIEKVVVNTGFGKKIQEKTPKQKKEWFSFVEQELALITGQKPSPTKAKTSISGFELQKGDVVGAKVTLRGKRMYDFLERLIRLALPRSRDFRGIKRKAIDSAGNMTIGIQDHTIFPEVDVETLKDSFGLEVTVKTDTKNRKRAVRLFELLQFPIQKEKTQ